MRMRDETNYAEYNQGKMLSRAQHSSEKTTPSSASTSAGANAPYGRAVCWYELVLCQFHDPVSEPTMSTSSTKNFSNEAPWSPKKIFCCKKKNRG
jgi:hypothetical protein